MCRCRWCRPSDLLGVVDLRDGKLGLLAPVHISVGRLRGDAPHLAALGIAVAQNCPSLYDGSQLLCFTTVAVDEPHAHSPARCVTELSHRILTALERQQAGLNVEFILRTG